MPLAVHDPAKVAAGSGADAGGGRGLPGRCRPAARRARVFGRWPRTRRCPARSTRWPRDAPAALAAIDTARAAARARVWALAGDHAPDHDIDAGVTAGHRRRRHPGHRALGEGGRRADVQDAASGTIRCGRSSTTDPTAPGSRWRCCCARATPAPTPPPTTSPSSAPRCAAARPPGRAPARPEGPDPHRRRRCHPRLPGLAAHPAVVLLGRVRPAQDAVDQLAAIPASDWQHRLRRRREIRDGAWVAEATGLLDLDRLAGGDAGHRPQGTTPPRRAAADHRRRRACGSPPSPPTPAPAAARQLADLELRHRRRARAEDRIRAAKDTGLTNLPLHDFDQNRIWCAIVALACEITAWTQTARLHRAPRPPVGTQTAPAPAVLPARPPSPARPPPSCCTCPPTTPGPASSIDGLDPAPPRSPPPADPTPPVPTTQHPTGPVEPAPTERPRPNRHTRQAESALTALASTSVDHQPRDEISGLRHNQIDLVLLISTPPICEASSGCGRSQPRLHQRCYSRDQK